MATTFGTQPGDIVTDTRGNALPGISLGIYGTRADADSSLSRLTTVITDSLGSWEYSDASNRNILYVRDPNGRVWAVEAEEATTGAPITGLAGLPAGSTFTIYWNGSNWTYDGAVIAARPTARTDLTMIAIGGSTGPGFGELNVDLWLRDDS